MEIGRSDLALKFSIIFQRNILNNQIVHAGFPVADVRIPRMAWNFRLETCNYREQLQYLTKLTQLSRYDNAQVTTVFAYGFMVFVGPDQHDNISVSPSGLDLLSTSVVGVKFGNVCL